MPRVVLALVLLLVAIRPALTQAQPDPVADRLARAQAARAAGELPEVLRLTAEILAVAPANRDAAALRIEAQLARQERRQAAVTYDRYVAATGVEDSGLLSGLAKAELKALSLSEQSLRLRSWALERLARAGDQSAREELRAMALSHKATIAERVNGNISLARLGDAGAGERLGSLAASPELRDRTSIVEALEAAGVRSSSAIVVGLLDDPNPTTRAASARALGTLKAYEAIPRLQKALADPVFLVRLSAAVGLKRLGDTSADGLLAGWLRSDLADVRLVAAEAYQDGVTREWTKAILPLVDHGNDLTRLKAAELLMGHEAARSRSILVDAVRSPNPAVREAASRLLERLTPPDLRLLRGLLDDASPWVRLHAAGAILIAAGLGLKG